VSPDHQASNIVSWEDLERLIEEYPDNSQWTEWKTLARKFVDESVKLGLNRYFRAGQSMHHFVFSTLEYHGLRDEPRVTVAFRPENDIRIAYGTSNLQFSTPMVEYTLPFDLAFPTFRRFLNQLWKATMPEAIPGDICGPQASLSAPILTK
jgi:hypothetical protein